MTRDSSACAVETLETLAVMAADSYAGWPTLPPDTWHILETRAMEIEWIVRAGEVAALGSYLAREIVGTPAAMVRDPRPSSPVRIMPGSAISSAACASRPGWDGIRIPTSDSSGLRPSSTVSTMRTSHHKTLESGRAHRACLYFWNSTIAMSFRGLQADSPGRRDLRPGEPELSRRMDGSGRETPSVLPRRVSPPHRRARRC